MAYEPKEWACGEVVTADALNHIEQGIADAGGGSDEVLTVNCSVTTPEEFRQMCANINTTSSRKTLHILLEGEELGYYPIIGVARYDAENSIEAEVFFNIQTIEGKPNLSKVTVYNGAVDVVDYEIA